VVSCLPQEGFTYQDHIFVVNNGSHRIHFMRDTVLTVLRHKTKGYALASARNAGIKAALSAGYKWGLFLDDDMRLEEGCLAAHKKAVEGSYALPRGIVTSPVMPALEHASSLRVLPPTGTSRSSAITVSTRNSISDAMPKIKDNHALYRGIVTSEQSCGDDAFLGDLLERLPETEIVDADSKHGLEHDLLLRILRFGGITNTCMDLKALSDAGGFDEGFDGGWGYEDTELINRLILRDGWSVRFVRDAVAYHAAAKPANDSYSRDEFVENKRLFQKLAREYRRE